MIRLKKKLFLKRETHAYVCMKGWIDEECYMFSEIFQGGVSLVKLKSVS